MLEAVCLIRCRSTSSDCSAWHVQPAGGVVTAARDEGLIVITAGAGDVVRLVPPLTITNDDVHLAVSILASVLNSLQAQNQTV